jgi:hypothetical protein
MVKKTGRNEPCPCGSGKKFKKCCIPPSYTPPPPRPEPKHKLSRRQAGMLITHMLTMAEMYPERPRRPQESFEDSELRRELLALDQARKDDE